MGYTVNLSELGSAQVDVGGGKGASLGELSRIDGVVIPPGFCVTTDAFARVIAQTPAVGELLDRLVDVAGGERAAIAGVSAELRRVVEAAVIPDDVERAITSAVAGLGDGAACAVRSSATAEDSAGASFAGQHDSYLEVVGTAAILAHVRRCWASLFSERAVTYRLRNAVGGRDTAMAVVVQRMVKARAAGVMFTADPVSGHRALTAIEAVPGLGEALVSGLARPDAGTVRDGAIVRRTTADRAEAPVLTDPQVTELAQLGRRIEAHFGCPQDIEWCLGERGFAIVQTRPITTLFPIPAVAADGERHVFVSVGHQQMMTDPMKPLGISMFQLTAGRPMYEAGGRLFVDIARELASSTVRERMIGALGTSDPLIGDALRTVVARGDLLPPVTDESSVPVPPALGDDRPAPLETDPAIVAELIARTEEALVVLRHEIASRSGADLIDFIAQDVQERQRTLFDPRSLRVILAAMQAAHWLNEHLLEWLGERNTADVLTQSVPYNVTAAMGLELLDVADVVRRHPHVVEFLGAAPGEEFLSELPAVEGGEEARAAIAAYLDKYGMRCIGEIDITRPRWGERPSTLVPMILGNVRNFEPGAGHRRFEDGLRAASAKEQEVLERLRALPDGETKADETKRMIDRVRTFTGYREFPKYGIVSRYFIYKQALMKEAERLAEAGVIAEPEDIFFLTYTELRDAVAGDPVCGRLIRERAEAFRSFAGLTPPRVMTSDGEIVTGAYNRDDLPAGALVGLAVSSGTVEGRARVITEMADADLRPGDILVTAYTDPSWSPLFVAIAGLVTEVGGLMTHGAVIAREYGLPGVVGVERATSLIADGQRIRVNGTEGWVEILE